MKFKVLYTLFILVISFASFTSCKGVALDNKSYIDNSSEVIISEKKYSEYDESEIVQNTEELFSHIENEQAKELIIKLYNFKSEKLTCFKGCARLGYLPLSEEITLAENGHLADTFVAEITNKDALIEFKKTLQLQKWKLKKYNTRSLAGGVIYLSEDFHINVDEIFGGIYWVKICSPQASYYFSVPEETYNYLFDICDMYNIPRR